MEMQSAQSGRNQTSKFRDIHVIATAIGDKGTLDGDGRATMELARGWADLGAPIYSLHSRPAA